MDRSQRVRDQQPAHRRRVRGRVEASSAMEFFNVLTSPEMLELTEGHLPEHRERLYPPTVTLAMFLRQALSADASCQQAVNTWAVSRAAEGLSPQSVRTDGYCRARARLPLSMVQHPAEVGLREVNELAGREQHGVCIAYACRTHRTRVNELLADGGEVNPTVRGHIPCFHPDARR